MLNIFILFRKKLFYFLQINSVMVIKLLDTINGQYYFSFIYIGFYSFKTEMTHASVILYTNNKLSNI